MQKAPLNKWLVVQSIVFLAISLSLIVPNGNLNCVDQVCNLSIGSWHMHDALWHISLAKLGFSSWPPQNPFLSGSTLHGYNFLLDFILFCLYKIGISPFFSFFKLIPVIAGVLYVWSVIKFVNSRTTDMAKANLMAFFLYFGSSLSYLATLYKDHTFYYSSLRGFPVVTSINPAAMFLNIQFAFSLSIVLWILMIAKPGHRKGKHFLLGILFFLLFGFKFYGGVVGLMLVTGMYLPEIFKRKINREYILSLSTMAIGSITGILIFYGTSGALKIPFSWAPFALTRLLIDDPLLFYNHNLTLARYYLYENNSGFSPRLLAIEGFGVVLFLLVNFGVRLLGVFYVVKEFIHRRLTGEYKIFSVAIIVTTLIPIFFVQDGGWYNTMQFLYYGVWLSGILMAEMLYEVISKKKYLGYIFTFIIIMLTIPNNIEQLRLLNAKQNVVNDDELKALNVLKDAPDGVVHIFNSEHKDALVSALAEKTTYYLDTDQLMVTHAPYEDKLAFMKKYSGGSITTVPANYYFIYKYEWGTEDAIRALSSPSQYKLIYDSQNIAIYQKI